MPDILFCFVLFFSPSREDFDVTNWARRETGFKKKKKLGFTIHEEVCWCFLKRCDKIDDLFSKLKGENPSPLCLGLQISIKVSVQCQGESPVTLYHTL